MKLARPRARKPPARAVKKKKHLKIIVEPGKLELIVIGEVEAPRELVFRAHTDPELYKEWLGPRGMTTRFIMMEPRSGGIYRFVQKDADGKEYAFHGVYHEVLAPERIIGTFEYEGLPEPGHVLLETTRFEALPRNRTRIVVQDVFQSVVDRDGMVQTGMEKGLSESYERLDEVLDKLQSKKIRK